ncbi:TPA: hypothetical protein HA231_04050 [Candidatus Woesearchaeota archaeon]|nr:hypothetical protein [Candidatus Woesearchaeota archaeon]
MVNMHKARKAQTISTDAVVGVMLFVTAAILLFYLAGPVAKNRQADHLRQEAERLPSLLSSEQNLTTVLISGSQANPGNVESLLEDYENLKEILGIDAEFCVYFEDENGNIVPLQGRVGMGSSLVNISGMTCNASVYG